MNQLGPCWSDQLVHLLTRGAGRIGRSIEPWTPLFWVTEMPSNEPPAIYSKRDLQKNVVGYLDDDPDKWLLDINNYVIDQNTFAQHQEIPLFSE